MIWALCIVRLEAVFKLEGLYQTRSAHQSRWKTGRNSTDNLIVNSTVPMLGAHVLGPRHLRVKMPIAVPAETMIGAPHVVPPPRIITFESEVAVIAGPVGVGIILVLPKGLLVREPSLTAIAIRHQMAGVQRLKVKWVTYRTWEFKLVFERIAWKTCALLYYCCEAGLIV